eukprot:7146611-Prymnesium_polylepis.1
MIDTLIETESLVHSTRCHMPAGTYSTDPGRSSTSGAPSQKASGGAASNGPLACCACSLACCSAARRTASEPLPHCGVQPRTGAATWAHERTCSASVPLVTTPQARGQTQTGRASGVRALLACADNAGRARKPSCRARAPPKVSASSA